MKCEKATGRFAIVTSVSSRIGFELAKQFALNGFNLLIANKDSGIVECRTPI